MEKRVIKELAILGVSLHQLPKLTPEQCGIRMKKKRIIPPKKVDMPKVDQPVVISSSGKSCGTGEKCGVTEVYADGGMLSASPSPHGLTWAWCHVGEGILKLPGGTRLVEESGVLTCADLGMDICENNLAETLALLFALEPLPDGWCGVALSDNKNAILRLTGKSTKMTGVPQVYRDRIKAVIQRLSRFKTTLLKGHPTVADLRRGRHKSNKPVSIHNVRCDQACCKESERWWKGQVIHAEG
jgi:hypothetical protein